jgi:hypothetical protein
MKEVDTSTYWTVGGVAFSTRAAAQVEAVARGAEQIVETRVKRFEEVTRTALQRTWGPAPKPKVWGVRYLGLPITSISPSSNPNDMFRAIRFSSAFASLENYEIYEVTYD